MAAQIRSTWYVRVFFVLAVIVSVAFTAQFTPVPLLAQQSSIQFEDITEGSGIDFIHSDGSSDEPLIQSSVTGGLATFDFDNDGLVDILFTSAPRPQSSARDYSNRLYKNLGDWKFQDVTESSGLSSRQFTLGVATGDYNNDGYPDIFLNNLGPNALYVNNGDGTFTELADPVFQASGRLGAGACLLDVDGDGHLDLWIGNYVNLNARRTIPRFSRGQPTVPGPRDFEADNDQLLRNNGDGTFSDITENSGLARRAGTSMGGVAFDFDRDGDTDLFICNDNMENFLWLNDGTGKFQEVALLIGVAGDSAGSIQGNMGVGCADVNRDGWLDLAVTNFDSEIPNLYISASGKYFDDLSARFGLGSAIRDVKWGIVLNDFDNDGFTDLAMATGHLNPNAVNEGSLLRYASRNRLYRNVNGQKFVEIIGAEKSGFETVLASRGMAADDLDNDGRVDLVINNFNAPAQILRNITSNNNHWSMVRLIGTRTSRSAAGSVVTILTGSGELVQEVMRGKGYQSDYGHWIYFGLGQERVESIQVHWHGGGHSVISSPQTDSRLTIVQE